MASCRTLALALLVSACNNPLESAAHTDPPGRTQAPPPRAEEPVHPLCEALLPTFGKWDAFARRHEVLATLVAHGHVGPCDHRGSVDAQPAPGSDETSYCRAAIGHELCKRPEQVQRAIEGRSREFPESADAWFALATWKFSALSPDSAHEHYNASIPPQERLRITDEVLATLRHVDRLRPNDPRVYDLIAAVHEQRLLARMTVAQPTTAAQKQEVTRAHHDAELEWQARTKACELHRPPCRPSDPVREPEPVSDLDPFEEEEIPPEP